MARVLVIPKLLNLFSLSFAERFGVGGFPTLLMFSKGSMYTYERQVITLDMCSSGARGGGGL